MHPKDLLISAAFAGMLTAALPMGALAAPNPNDKCYGIAKAGLNNCAQVNGVHSCAGKAEIDNDPADFVYLATVDCLKEGGKRTPPPAPAKKDQDQ